MLIYVDTNIWIYAYENDPVFGEAARQMLAHVRAKRPQLAGSLFVLGELLVLPTHQKNEFAVAAYRRLFASRQVKLLPYGSRGMETYVELRASRRLKPVDALHLATAAEAGTDIFVTEDERLLSQSVDGVAHIADLASIKALL